MSTFQTAALGVILILAMSTAGCSKTGNEKSMTVKQVQAQAIAELQAVVALAPETWGQDLPRPVPNDCTIGAERGVQFTYFIEADSPSDPEGLVHAASERWEQQGYRLTKTRTNIDADHGDIFAVVAKATGKPSASMSATIIRAHVYVNSVCVKGDPDEYR